MKIQTLKTNYLIFWRFIFVNLFIHFFKKNFCFIYKDIAVFNHFFTIFYLRIFLIFVRLKKNHFETPKNFCAYNILFLYFFLTQYIVCSKQFNTHELKT